RRFSVNRELSCVKCSVASSARSAEDADADRGMWTTATKLFTSRGKESAILRTLILGRHSEQ
ncbi:Hypothetical predicted protein, partial [Podarcis lilfordi]